MKLITVLSIWATVLIACSSPTKNGNTYIPDTPIGLWVSTEPDSFYVETIYFNNISWTYTDEFGVTSRIYRVNNDVVEKFYPDGTPFLSFKMLKLTKDSLVTSYKGNIVHSYRLNLQYDFESIINGNMSALDNYRGDLRKRRAKWESGLP